MKSNAVQTAILVDRISGMLNVDMRQPLSRTAVSLHPSCAGFVRGALVSGAQTVHLLDVDALMAALAV
jgi:chemotaxis signal transduction protein